MRLLRNIGLLLNCMCLVNGIVAQTFSRNSSISVLNYNGDTIENPWAGGFNSVQFSEIDLDIDGIKDLISFDKSGDRLATFVNAGISGQVNYTHDPYYLQFFPKMKSWVLLRDFNCDGKMDIFTYFSGGMKVYKNTSTTTLSFAVADSLVKSNYQPDSSPNYIALYVSSADIPVIDDIDGDGDLDILTFSVGGIQVEYHKNLSMEKYGTCDSLDFELSNRCWGFFRESSIANNIILFDTCSFNINNPQKGKHSGSTLLTLDIDANGSKDLILGDVSYNNLSLLVNQDTSQFYTSSSISSKDTAFPANNNSTIATDLYIFPAAYYFDVNNDNVKDLICATNAVYGVKNTKNVWLYKNNNATNLPDFSFSTNAFLQEEMIEVGEGAHPVFFDYNADGLLDIVVGSYGIYDTSYASNYYTALWLYENVGTATNPAFQLVDSNYANLANINLDLIFNQPALRIIPAFGDLDGDGDEDMLVGEYNGNLHYFENTAGAGNTANFVLAQPNYMTIDVGNFSAPYIIDLNRDGLLDLVVGERFGYMRYYENTGTSALPNFPSVTNDSLGYAKTFNTGEFNGNTIPCVYEYNGNYKILAGSSNGHIYQFTNIDGNLNGTFTADTSFQNIWEGIYSAVSVGDINNDNEPDLLIGNQSGGVALYLGDFTIAVDDKNSLANIKLYPNPVNDKLVVDLGEIFDSNTEIYLYDMLGKPVFYTNANTSIIQIQMNDFAQGIYFVHVSNTLGNQVYKVIKK